MDDKKDNVIVVDFKRRARPEKAVAVSSRLPAAIGKMSFTDHEMLRLMEAFRIGRDGRALRRFDTDSQDYYTHFRMYQKETGPWVAIYVCKERGETLSNYKCWTTYSHYQTISESRDFESFMAAVRDAVRAMVAYVNRPGGPGPS